jgi:hypothetical protein
MYHYNKSQTCGKGQVKHLNISEMVLTQNLYTVVIKLTNLCYIEKACSWPKQSQQKSQTITIKNHLVISNNKSNKNIKYLQQ